MANQLTQRLDSAWQEFRAAVDKVGPARLEKPTPAGWTGKEMLGHIAFWNECTEPVVIGILRGDFAAMAGWRFGSGYVPDEKTDWPAEDVHNAREAEWARGQSVADVLARLDAAYTGSRAAIETFTVEEVADGKFIAYATEQTDHLNAHRSELEALTA